MKSAVDGLIERIYPQTGRMGSFLFFYRIEMRYPLTRSDFRNRKINYEWINRTVPYMLSVNAIRYPKRTTRIGMNSIDWAHGSIPGLIGWALVSDSLSVNTIHYPKSEVKWSNTNQLAMWISRTGRSADWTDRLIYRVQMRYSLTQFDIRYLKMKMETEGKKCATCSSFNSGGWGGRVSGTLWCSRKRRSWTTVKERSYSVLESMARRGAKLTTESGDKMAAESRQKECWSVIGGRQSE